MEKFNKVRPLSAINLLFSMTRGRSSYLVTVGAFDSTLFCSFDGNTMTTS